MARQSFLYLINLFVPWTHRELIFSLVQREINSRYRNSIAGLIWSIITPAFTLLVYTLVFTKVFTVRWPGSNESPTEFALLIFIGMTIFNLFSECVLRAPALIVTNTNYVKKIVFPLEALPWTSLGVGLFHMLVGSAVWLVFHGLMIGAPPISGILYPFILFPLILLILGLSWIVSALGVYFRDISHIIGALLLPLMFLTPVFYPTSALPPEFHQAMALNPLAQVIENARTVLFWGGMPNFTEWGESVVLSAIFAILSLWFFQKSREGFSDVL
jgi:lipopolysaccharide transport system permease protein